MTDKTINGLSLKGSLEEFPFPCVLQYLYELKATGRLVLIKGEITKAILLVEGKPVNVDSTLRDETLGRYLIKKGKISEEDFEKSIQLMMDKNLQQGAALVKIGCLSAKELYYEVKSQSREKMLSCFGWTTASFSFYPEVDFVEDTYRFEIAMPQIMHEGINRFLPPGAIESQLAKISPGPIAPVPDFMDRIGDYELTEDESAFVILIDGERDLLSLKNEADSQSFSTKLIYLLLVVGLIGPQGKPDAAIRSLGDQDLDMPPIEDFVKSARDTSVEDGQKLFEKDEDASEMFDFQPTPGVDMEIEDIEEVEDVQEQEMEAEEELDEVGEIDAIEAAGDELEEEKEGVVVKIKSMEEGPPDLPPLEDADLREESEILEFYMGIKSADFFSLLNVSRDTDDAQIEDAYRRLLNRYDENLFEPLSSEALAKLEEVHTRIIRAYEELRTEKARKRYIAKLEKKAKPARTALQAEHFLQKGLQFVRKREWSQAQKMFEQAVEAGPGEPEYRSYLGWTIYSNPEIDLHERTSRAKELLGEAMELNPNMDSSHVFMAKILKDEGAVEEAVEEFETALRCNAKCREAVRELKAHEQGEW